MRWKSWEERCPVPVCIDQCNPYIERIGVERDDGQLKSVAEIQKDMIYNNIRAATRIVPREGSLYYAAPGDPIRLG